MKFGRITEKLSADIFDNCILALMRIVRLETAPAWGGSKVMLENKMLPLENIAGESKNDVKETGPVGVSVAIASLPSFLDKPEAEIESRNDENTVMVTEVSSIISRDAVNTSRLVRPIQMAFVKLPKLSLT